MNDYNYLQIKAAQLRRLLDEAEDDPILAPQLRQRLEDVEGQLRAVQNQQGTLFPMETEIPRVALFLRGGGVRESEGIRPALAGEALIQYERMFMEQAIHDERTAAQAAGRARRRRGSPAPSLLFTGTPRGSFGLEFVPQKATDEALLPVHSQSLKKVADALVRISESDPAPGTRH